MLDSCECHLHLLSEIVVIVGTLLIFFNLFGTLNEINFPKIYAPLKSSC